MSRSVNRVFLVGHVGRDPDIRTTNSGTQVANFSLATNDGWGDNEKTNWHRIVAFGKVVDVIERYVGRGDRLHIEGRLDYGSYERDGVEIPTCEIIVDELVMLGGSEVKAKESYEPAQPGTGMEPGEPF